MPPATLQDELSWRDGWWHEAFPRAANASERRGHPRGAKTMYVIIAYDICEPKRLRKSAACCLDFGVRVQKSVFECRLPADRFELFWKRLCEIADPAEDKLVAYPIHGAHAASIRTFGTMVCSEQVVAYIF